MAWKDQLRAASFRGAPFFVDSREGTGGRKTVAHEYPLKDLGFVEDLGRRTRGFTVEAYVLGNDYMAARDALLKALEAEGPGTLVDPYRGSVTVAANSFRFSEKADEGGVCRFAIDFTETPAQPAQPSATTDTAGAVASSGASALGQLSTSFLAAFNVSGQPEFALASLTQIMKDATATVDAAFAPLITDAQQLAAFKAQALALVSGAQDLVNAPANLVTDVLAILGFSQNIAGSSSGSIDALLRVADFTSTAPAPTATTPSRSTEAANQVELYAFWKTAALIQAATAAPAVTFASYNDATDARDAILDRLETITETVDDSLYSSAIALRAALVAAVPGTDNALARIVSITPRAGTSSLVLAFRTYGDLLSEADLVERNNIRHPGFIPGGVALQVLGRV